MFFFCRFLLIALISSFVLTGYAVDIKSIATSAEPVAYDLAKLPDDDLNRRTPRGTVEGFLGAMADDDFEKASQYLNLDFINKRDRLDKGVILAKNFKRLLDSGGTISASALISNKVSGDQNDELKSSLDQIGSIVINGESFPVYVERVDDLDGNPIWLFASETIKQIPSQVSVDFYTRIDKLLPEYIKSIKLSGGSIGHWMAVVLVLVLAFILAWVITLFIFNIIIRILRKTSAVKHKEVITAFLVPIRLWLAVTIFIFIARGIGISILVRQFILPATIFIYWLAFLILLWQVTNVLSVIFENKMRNTKNYAALTGVDFTRRSIKFILIAAVIIIALKLNGQDVTNWLAAIGIGGIALALGAQKTIENIVGSISLIADQPIRIGDFCKVDNSVGTIIQIGIRSTRLRTLDRTIVTIPNGEFSRHKIENYTKRDTFLYRTRLTMRYETTPDQVRYLLIKLRELLHSHPRVNNDPNHPEPTRVRFVEFGADSLVLELYAQIITEEWHLYLEIREDLNLRIMDIVAQSGTSFAFPSQTLYLAKDQGLSKEKSKETEDYIKDLKDKKQLPLPEYSDEQSSKMRGNIKFPPEESILS